MRKCPLCHYSSLNDNFCTECGEKTIPVNTCNYCHKDILFGQNFCAECGHPTTDKQRGKKELTTTPAQNSDPLNPNIPIDGLKVEISENAKNNIVQ
jgi:predicted amidophosphoribosyltransferase